MKLDKETLLWSDAALSATGVSTNKYDFGHTAGGFGTGEPVAMIVTVDVAAKVTGTETYEFQVVQATADDGTTGQDVLVSVPFTTALAGTRLKAGAIVVVPIPPGSVTKRYLCGKFVGANTPTITVTAFFAPLNFAQVTKDYPKGYTI